MARIETLCVQGGYTPKNGEPRQIPIIQSTTFKYDTSEDMGKLFDLEASGYFYTRLQNPTNDTVAARICALEGGTAAMLTSSGQAANFYAVFNIANAGDHVVACSAIYGGTYNLFAVTMRKMGIDFTFVSPDCTDEELNAAFRPNTKALFGEKRIAQWQEALIQKYGSSDYKALTPSMRATFNKVLRQDMTECLQKIRSSTLLVWGAEDTATPLWMGQEMEKKIPDAGLVTLKGCGHFAYLDKYPEFKAIVRSFIG